MYSVQPIQRKLSIVHARIVNDLLPRHDLHRTWKSAWVRILMNYSIAHIFRPVLSTLLIICGCVVLLISGIGRNSSRIASRRIASARDGNNFYGTAMSDDEDDADWAGDKKKKKIQPIRTNGSKKNGKTT